jgi:polysaccharide export outer membrane protein
MKYYLLPILLLAFTGCSTKDDYVLFNQAEKTQSQEILQSSDIQFEYKILPHDRISVMVYKHPELSTTMTLNSLQQEKGLLVNSKGNIRLPLVDKIKIAGLTQTEAEDAISDAFATYLKHPDVQIEVMNKRAYVVGEVNKPGEIKLDNERLTLLQILAVAGDLTTHANRKSILIFKAGDAKHVRTRVINLTDKNSLLSANLMVEPNDIVYVMPNDMKAFNNTVQEISPIFSLIGNILSPFVSIKFLSN